MQVLAVNVAMPKVVSYKGYDLWTGIYKTPVYGSVVVRKTNIDGDAQADLKNHGGPDQAVYAFPSEHYAFYQERFEQVDFEYGHFGENLTTEGILEEQVHIGDQFRIGGAIFEVSQPRSPCFKFAMKMGSPDAVKTMLNSGNTGFYLRVVSEGKMERGEVNRLSLNATALTVVEMHRLMYFDLLDVTKLKRALGSSALSSKWREVFATRLRKLEVNSEANERTPKARVPVADDSPL